MRSHPTRRRALETPSATDLGGPAISTTTTITAAHLEMLKGAGINPDFFPTDPSALDGWSVKVSRSKTHPWGIVWSGRLVHNGKAVSLVGNSRDSAITLDPLDGQSLGDWFASITVFRAAAMRAWPEIADEVEAVDRAVDILSLVAPL